MNEGVMILLIFFILIIISIICVHIIYVINKYNRKNKIKKYISEVKGKIVELKNRGLDCPTIMTVQYQVDDVKYTISESIKLKSQAIKLGPIPIGQRKIPIMGDIKKGTIVTVKYDPENPSKAIIKENGGFQN